MGGEILKGVCCILCREFNSTTVYARQGQSPVPDCQWEHMSLGLTNTFVSILQSPHQSDHSARLCSVITHHCLLGRGREGQPDGDADSVTAISITKGMCWKNRESERDRESEWEGRWGKDSLVWNRETGGEARNPPPSCERLEAVCEHIWMGLKSWKDWCENSQTQTEEDPLNSTIGRTEMASAWFKGYVVFYMFLVQKW